MNLEKLTYHIIEAAELNKWFESRKYDYFKDLDFDTICTYLAFRTQVNEDTLENIEKFPKVVQQIADALKKINNDCRSV